MVSVNIPIWWDKLSAGVREARHRHFAAVHRKIDATNTLSATLKLAAYGFRDANRKIDLYRDTLLPLGRKSLKATDTSFRAGKASFTDLIDAQRILLNFELAYERALANKARRLAELESLTAQEFSSTSKDQGETKTPEKNKKTHRRRSVRTNATGLLDPETDSL
jgi:outer membrane protein TolC